MDDVVNFINLGKRSEYLIKLMENYNINNFELEDVTAISKAIEQFCDMIIPIYEKYSKDERKNTDDKYLVVKIN